MHCDLPIGLVNIASARTAAHEAAVLQVVERIVTPTPRLIGVDPTVTLPARRPN